MCNVQCMNFKIEIPISTTIYWCRYYIMVLKGFEFVTTFIVKLAWNEKYAYILCSEIKQIMDIILHFEKISLNCKSSLVLVISWMFENSSKYHIRIKHSWRVQENLILIRIHCRKLQLKLYQLITVVKYSHHLKIWNRDQSDS